MGGGYGEKALRQDLKDTGFVREYGAELAKLSISETLIKARKEAGLTQQKLARKTGHSQPYIAKLERGDANPTLAAIGSILAVLGVRLNTSHVPLAPGLKPEGPLLSKKE